MLKLIPLEETADVKELMSNYGVKLLTNLVEAEFSLAPNQRGTLIEYLSKLDLTSLEAFSKELPRLKTLEALENWLNKHLQDGGSVNISLN